ncbi:MAG: hypothetical protein IJP02_04665 [Oscillospiraceae bacterium]|nr:hypothetical protein [Oscillospiraceae bacterium]
MTRIKKILCIILALILLCIGGIAIWQWDNITALINGLRYTTEELEDKLAQNDQAIKDAVAALPGVSFGEMTDEERQALHAGEITHEQLVESMVNGSKTEQSGQPEEGQSSKSEPKPQPEQPPAKPPEQTAYEKQLSAVIAKVYVLREDFMGRLDALMNQAIAEYKSIPPEERAAKLASFVSGYMSKGLDMEKECDAQIEAIIIELETLLSENNGDMSIAQTVYDTYVEEKSLKKAWYMAELKKRGFV